MLSHPVLKEIFAVHVISSNPIFMTHIAAFALFEKRKRQGALHRFLQVSRAAPPPTNVGGGGARSGGGIPRRDERAAEAMRCRLAEARVLWGKCETDSALRATRAVVTRLRARVGGDALGSAGGVAGVGPREQEEQRLLSEVRCNVSIVSV